MHTKCLAFVLMIWTLTLASCEEPEAWQNNRRYDKTQSAVFISSENADLEIAGAWRPSAVWAESATTVVFADRATRQLNRFDLQTHEIKRLADLGVYEQVLNPKLAFDETWGEQLLALGARKLAVLGPKRAVAIIDLASDDVSILGKIGGLTPREGLRLGEVDFSDFSGFGQDQGFVYMSFGTELFRLKRTGEGGVDFGNSQLEHLAGAKHSAEALNFQTAKNASLHLDLWTRFISDKGLLYFWEPPHFRAIKDGMLISLGGNGFQTPSDSNMKDFYARHLPSSPALVLKDGKFYSPYWRLGLNLIEMDIDSISSVDGSSRGYVRELPLSSSGISDFSVMGAAIFSVTEAAGNLWMTHLDSLESVLLFGPRSETARFQSISEGEKTYDVQAAIAPQSLISMLGGSLLLAYAPSLSRLSGLSSKYAKYVQTVWTAKQEINLQHMLSDNKGWAWFASDAALYSMHIDTQYNVAFSYKARFFSAPRPSGAPAPSPLIKLTESPQIVPYNSGFLLYMRESKQILEWDRLSDEVLSFADPDLAWTKLTKTSGSLERLGLKLTDIVHFSSYNGRQVFVQDDGVNILIGVANIDGAQAAYGKILERNAVTLIAGQGERALDEGLEPSDIRFSKLTAMSFDPQNLNILMAADNALWQIDEAGLISKLGKHCAVLPDASPQAFVRLYAGQTEVLAILASDGQTYACSDGPVYLGEMALTQAWTAIDSKLIAISTCGLRGSTLGILKDNLVCGLELGAKPQKALCSKAEKGWHFDHLGCRADKSLVSATEILSQDGNDPPKNPKYALYEVDLSKNNHARYAMGLGLGLLDSGPISKTPIGYQLGKMATDGIPAIYFWMRDTCSIWRVVPDPKRGIEDESIVTRHITHPKLCSATSMAVRFDSSIAIIDDKKLWQWQDSDFQFLADIPSETLDMLGMGQAFVILTRDGIYTYEAQRLGKRAPNPIQIDAESIDYALGGPALPKMLQVLGENAIYVPVFNKNRIIKIAL